MSFPLKHIVIAFTLLSSATFAGTTTERIVIAPKCLLEHSAFSYQTLSANQDLILLKTNNAGIEQLITMKNNTHKPCGGFMDVTHAWSADLNNAQTKQFLAKYSASVAMPGLKKKRIHEVRYQAEVNQLLSQLNPQTMWSNLAILTSFKDRYANSDNGVKAAEWIKTQVETIAQTTGHADVTAYYVATGDKFKQPSVVVKVGNSNEPGVVIGAHMDTLNSAWEKKPGADDDGSGSMTVLEAARTVLSSGMHFKKPIYFIWYAAEEEGLIGSQFVVADFQEKKIPVNAVIHFDMTGFAYKNESTMWLMDDYTDKNLTDYISTLITTYVKKPVKHSKCGYDCSDHATWTLAGYPATIPAEAAYENTNPALHTSRDTMERLSLEHMTDYAKLAVAAAVELAEPASK